MNCVKEKNHHQTSDIFYYLYGYLPYRYFYFKKFSPDISFDDGNAYLVNSDGDVEYGWHIDNSYGISMLRKNPPWCVSSGIGW